ncbi:MAG TPA: SAM-dependent methyltransferase [Roseateles sp.]|uniref:SAM-dependent methyltransferase n=1 Tax=Roseateles sp. TaxID=1971397 RepID=UPI002EDB8CE4
MSSAKGRLILMPNTLDFGVDDSLDLREVLPQRVIEQAASLRHWAAENAKTTRALLKRVDAVTPLAQPLQAVQITELPRPPKGGHSAGKPTADDAAWRALLEPAFAGHDLGLISEAGLPAVADPGARLVALAHEAGIDVLPLSGPSSLLLALAASGLNGQSFAFVGYLPVDAGGRAARIRELETLSARAGQTQLLIETPYRNEALREALLATLKPTTRLSISVGLTLPGGWTRTATVSDWKRGSSATSALPDRIPAVFALLA